MFLLFILNCMQIVFCIDHLEGWNYINLHCRDNDNQPVDWWYMYKPPVDIIPFLTTARNFSYITPETGGRWRSSGKVITSNSMLQHTLAPIYRPTYTDYLAVVAYESGNGTDASAMGVMMADELGGVWIGHTIPGLLDFTKDRPIFPESESQNGHLLTCLSLDLITLNEVALHIRQIAPRYTRHQVPELMRPYLPTWNLMQGSDWKGFDKMVKRLHLIKKDSDKQDSLDFRTQNKTLRATLMVRKPGEKNILYKKFAQKKKLVLDVYGKSGSIKPMCLEDYGVRQIDMISLKNREFVYYVHKSKDRSGFAVSTAAHWQRTGAGGRRYWTCTSSAGDPRQCALMLCVEDYHVWTSFDRFKVKEPEC